MILDTPRPSYEEIQHLANQWEGKPKRKGALHEIRKLQTTMELKRDLQTARKTGDDIRPYAGIRRAGEIAFRNRIDTTGRIRRWLTDVALAIGGSVLVCSVLAHFLKVMEG